MPRPLHTLARFADGRYIDRPACDAAFTRMHRRDRVGDRLHLAFACLGLFLLAGPVTVTELAFAPLLVFFFVRVVNTGPLWVHAFGQPLILAALALMAWMLVTLAWSPDRANGLDEIGRLRWLVLGALIYPAIGHRRALTLALALGLIVGGIAQLLSGLDALRPPFETRAPGRITGWWNPVIAGSIQCAALGLFLPGAIRGVGRERWIGVLGLAIALAGLLASGTRGAWIAGAILLAVGVPLILRGSGRGGGGAWRAAVGIGVGAVLLLAVVAFVQRDGLAYRVQEARAELAAAADGDLDTWTGARVAVMGFAIESGLRHPWGLGAGGLRASVERQLGPDHPAALPHAHSAPLHLFATLGWPGLCLGVLVAWIALRHARRDQPPDPRRALEAGLPYAIAGLLLAGLFDAVHINTQTCAMLGALAALSPAYRPEREPTAEVSG
ncbi:MAG: O-antigen ligase family protein [Phycisphaerales bacterium]|nr:O-antigen ligase family protein [Planctomycetota bacterium]MCH8509305.1 O-antigen ligase family protein [Phycisphaerales bacterium]